MLPVPSKQTFSPGWLLCHQILHTVAIHSCHWTVLSNAAATEFDPTTMNTTSIQGFGQPIAGITTVAHAFLPVSLYYHKSTGYPTARLHLCPMIYTYTASLCVQPSVVSAPISAAVSHFIWVLVTRKCFQNRLYFHQRAT